jgi:hypothetical protein
MDLQHRLISNLLGQIQSLKGTNEALKREVQSGRRPTPQQPLQSGRRPTPQQPLPEVSAVFPIMQEAELQRMQVAFPPSADQLHQVLDEFGVCVVTGILDPQQCKHMESMWQEDLLTLVNSMGTGPETQARIKSIAQDGVRQWPSCWNAFLGSKGVASQRGMPHGNFAWTARLNERVRQVYATMLDVDPENMSTGLDCPFWSAADSEPAVCNRQWLHVDQNLHRGRTGQCLQGVLYVWPADSQTSCTVVWPSSHKDVYQRIMRDAASKLAKHGGHTQQINGLQDVAARDELLQQGALQAKRMPCPAGSLLLWDSRTVHQVISECGD